MSAAVNLLSVGVHIISAVKSFFFFLLNEFLERDLIQQHMIYKIAMISDSSY